ncbi:MAG: hypothetical protein LBE36_13435 [Flavobacteriaceae bacterium]|jgi:hypothetical protein|nr:hypothetical protein [Flavobacteriaceae bacterium]
MKEFKITIYQAILRDKITKKNYHSVNGGWKESEEEAIEIAKTHCRYRDGEDEICKIVTQEVWAEDWRSPSIY